jgi:3-oxoacyl-[acyl-carrier-protein] synthase II
VPRVVVTGAGLVSPAGNELESFWRALMSGTCFIRRLQRFRCPEMDALVGAEVELPPRDALPPDVDPSPVRARCLELLLAAARRAMGDASLPQEARLRTGVAVGTTMGEERQIAELNERHARDGAAAIDPNFHVRGDNHRLPALAARRHGLGGPVLLAQSACSSGNAAVALAYDLVASGAVDAMLAGGADTFTRSIFCGFERMNALSRGVCRPFDRNRDGVSFGEGAAMIVLESVEHARRRGARVHGEIAGYGLASDAHHITAPDPSGDGCRRAIEQALATSGIAPGEVDYVSAHGTGTPYNDAGEARALVAALGEHARRVPTSSIKSMIGHTNGAASAIETVACLLAIRHQQVPPTANVVEPDPELGIDCVPARGRDVRVNTCLNLSAGFGGSNVAVVIRRAQ